MPDSSEDGQYDDTYLQQYLAQPSKIQRFLVVKRRLKDIRDGREGFYVGRQRKTADAVSVSRTSTHVLFDLLIFFFPGVDYGFIAVDELVRRESVLSALAWRPLVGPRISTELQWHVIRMVSSISSLKSMRLVCRSWNDEILRWTRLFRRLLFTVEDDMDISFVRERIEFRVGVFLSHHGIENRVTSITTYRWTLNDHCWFLHQLTSVTHVRIIECGTLRWLYCLPSSLTHLMVVRTSIEVAGGFQHLLQQPSRLTCLMLDSVRVVGLVRVLSRFNFFTMH